MGPEEVGQDEQGVGVVVIRRVVDHRVGLRGPVPKPLPVPRRTADRPEVVPEVHRDVVVVQPAAPGAHASIVAGRSIGPWPRTAPDWVGQASSGARSGASCVGIVTKRALSKDPPERRPVSVSARLALGDTSRLPTAFVSMQSERPSWNEGRAVELWRMAEDDPLDAGPLGSARSAADSQGVW